MNQYLWAAETILRVIRRPMGARELVDHALAEGLLSDKVHGDTPHKTMHARLAVDMVQHGELSRFVRTAPGIYFLRDLIGEVIVDDIAPGMLDGGIGIVSRIQVYDAPRRQPPPASEHVLAISREAFAKFIHFQGFKRDDGRLLKRLTSSPGATYLDRTDAEENPCYKQVVTYVIIVKKGAVLAFRRGSYSRAASFLRGNRCIGFGGHVTEGDVSLFSPGEASVAACAWRELHEEVALGQGTPPFPDSSTRFRYVGLINDDSSSVGQRHVAAIYEYDVEGDSAWTSIRRGEAAVNQLGWIDLHGGNDAIDLNEFEYWSQLCWRSFFPLLVRGQPRFKVIDAKPFADRHLIAVVGSIGSGKSVATRILAEKFGYGIVGSGRVLARLLGLPPIPESSRDVFQQHAAAFIATAEGPRRLARALLDAAHQVDEINVAIDGIRQRATLAELAALAKEDCGQQKRSVATLFVHAPPDVAYRFYRQREARGLSAPAFMQLYTAPVEAEVPFLISEADAVLYNWLGRPAYDQAVRDLMTALPGVTR